MKKKMILMGLMAVVATGLKAQDKVVLRSCAGHRNGLSITFFLNYRSEPLHLKVGSDFQILS